jgi:ATP-binding cassette subfamily C protein
MPRDVHRHRPAGTGQILDHARQAGANGLRATLAWQLLRAALKLLLAASLAIVAGQMIGAGTVSVPAIIVGLMALLLSGVVSATGDRRQAAAEIAVAEAVRADIRRKLETILARDVQALPAGALIAGLQRHPDSIGALVIGHRAAALMLGIGPLLVVAAIVAVSWEAALTLLLASPVMIVFSIVVGGTIHSRAAAQEKAFGRLATQFEDRIRTLPTILSAHGLHHERQKLDARMASYAASTMGVLKVAFLNAGIIDFFASLSIAVLAVFLGLGHLKLIDIPGFSGMELWQSLFILMLAPEFFAPFRRHAEQYHAKAEGNAAALALDGFLCRQSASASTVPPGLDFIASGASFRLPARGLVAIAGHSGSGKSTLLRRLAGMESSDGTGFESGADWISTDIHVPAGTLADALSWNRTKVGPPKLLLAASSVGLLDDRLMPRGLDTQIGAGGENLSGGQRLRIGIARALLSDRPIFADEPTAKLDARNAARVRQALSDCARGRLVVVATHDPELMALAGMVVNLDEQTITRQEVAT